MRVARISLAALLGFLAFPAPAQLQQQDIALSGHVYADLESPPQEFRHGISFYTTVHTLVPNPSKLTQLGSGTWLVPDNRDFQQPLCPVGTVARDNWPERGPSYRDVYQTLEGGIGSWGGTRYPSSGPKFRINGVPDCYNNQMGTSGFSFHGEPLAADKPGFAQLSNRLLMAPDGVAFQGTNVASLFGFGWFALPLIPAYTSPAGVPTGDRSMTLFFHAANFKGPVGFFPPETWSAVHAVDRTGVGRGHDAMPAIAGGAAVEIGFTPAFTASSAGVRYARIPRLAFAADSNREAILVQDITTYAKSAIWDRVGQGMNTGAAPTQFGPAGAFKPALQGRYWGLRLLGEPVTLDEGTFAGGATTTREGRPAFGLRWGPSMEAGVFPEYFRESGGEWRPVPASQVPPDTRLAEQTFTPAQTQVGQGLDTSPASPWTAGRWSAGPFRARLGDGSSVDYVWYRFIEQPAIARLGLAPAILDRLQAFAESLHATAGVNGVSFAPPTSGALTTLDAAQIVAPPAGMEKGFVPIAIRQYQDTAAPNRDYSDLWWNANESGWGLSFTQHGTTGFAAWYIYDDSGRPLWVVMPGGTWTSPRTFTGDLYTTTGPDPRGTFDPAAVVVTRVGTASLDFSSFAEGALSYVVNGIAHSRPITRQPFGARAANAAGKPNYGDLWWNAAESGWGISITQQNQSLFAVWYIYDPDGRPYWYVMPEGNWTAATTWVGPLYRTSAQALPFLSGGFNAAGVLATRVGTLELRFGSLRSATMTYVIDGVAGTKAITRQPF